MKMHHLLFVLAILTSPVLQADSSESDDSVKKEIKDQINEKDKLLIDALKAGVSTRADLMKLFTTDGGLHIAVEGSFRYRRCESVGIDVTFSCKTDAEGSVIEGENDVIKTISKPYWQPTFPQD